jgi:hypothetical protein
MGQRSTAKKVSETIRDLRESAREAANRAQQSMFGTTERIRDYQLQLVAAAQQNANALFEYARGAIEARSISDLMRLSIEHSRRQVEITSKQAQELAGSAQRIATAPPWPLSRLFGSQDSLNWWPRSGQPIGNGAGAGLLT